MPKKRDDTAGRNPATKRKAAAKPGGRAKRAAPKRTKRATTAPTPAPAPPVAAGGEPVRLTPVVGIVASAGGLEAFKRFFQAMPVDSGTVFMLVPHLDPRHESLMVGLLGKEPGVAPTRSKQYGLRIVEPILDAMEIAHHLIETDDDVATIAPAIEEAYARSRPVVLLVGRSPVAP